jgi:two-component system chemotaxis sensor kinase CheA
VDFLLEQFIEEAREQLNYLDNSIESLQSGEPELLNSVFRAAHTLKGGAGIVGFSAVQNITHQAEDLLDSLRSGKIEFKASIVSALYEAFDEVTALIDAAYEEGDTVAGDSEQISKIEKSLLQEIGGGGTTTSEPEKPTEWSPPFKIGKDIESLITLDFNFLGSVEQLKSKEVIDADNLNDKRLYGIELDIDERCMVFGNDPLYALSLFEDELVAVGSCINEEGAKYVLSGLQDEEGLNLRLRVTAFVDSRWSEIESNLYNFIDDIKLYPIDIDTILNISGERSEIPPLQELYSGLKEPLATGDKSEVNLHILNMLPLISPDTLQAKILSRFLSVLPFIDSSNLKDFDGLFKNLWRSSEDEPPEESTSSVEREELTSSTSVEKSGSQKESINLPDNYTAHIQDILEQQRYQLEHLPTSETKERVSLFLKSLEWTLPKELPESFNSIQELKHYIKTVLNSEIREPKKLEDDSGSVEEQKEVKSSEPVIGDNTLVDDNTLIDDNTLVDDNTPVSDDMFFDENALISDDGFVSDSDEVKKVESEPKKRESEERSDGKQQLSKMVKIEQQTIDKLMNLVGELLVAKNSLPYLVDSINFMNKEEIKRGILEKYTSINRLSSQLQDITMSMRMLPISYIFDRYPRLVRDMSKKLGKRVKLSIDGKETKLDKNMIEVLSEPLLHIMRNSLDHGIEPINDRLAKGKPEEGHISIKAFPQSDKIIIEVRDDGKGIDVERVVNKVLERDLMPVDEIEKLNSTEKLNLIFLPGLSTTDETSEYSGRGVGMDAVNKAINSFGGTIELESIPNQKTTIRLSIPSSLAVTALLHISMNGVHYGFPMDSVSETVKIDESEIRYLHNEPFIYIRGEVIPLIIIEDMLNMDQIREQTLSIVVLNIKGNLLAVVVNELLGQLDVVQKPFEGILETHPLLSGTALLGNGQIIMSIDPMGLFTLSNNIKVNRL